MISAMAGLSDTLTDEEVAEARQRRLEAMRIQEIEGNPLSPDQVAMFEMFEREKWSHERCPQYILERSREHSSAAAE
jgi:hypothetical protein